MAKHECNHCGTEVGLLQQIKMMDGNYLCRKCAAKTHPLFAPANTRTLAIYQGHLKQLEEGKILYEKLFLPRKKAADKSMRLTKLSGGMEVAKDIGLFAIVQKRGGFLFWGGTLYYMVFRLGDLHRYDYSSDQSLKSDGKKEVKHYIHLAFWNTAGVNECRVNISNEWNFTKSAKFFNECFGIQRNTKAGTTLKGHIENVKMAAKSIKTLVSGDSDNESKENAVEELTQAAKNELYGDRTEWLAKADEAIKSVLE